MQQQMWTETEVCTRLLRCHLNLFISTAVILAIVINMNTTTDDLKQILIHGAEEFLRGRRQTLNFNNQFNNQQLWPNTSVDTVYLVQVGLLGAKILSFGRRLEACRPLEKMDHNVIHFLLK